MAENGYPLSRRQLLHGAALGMAGLSLGGSALAAIQAVPATPTDTGKVQDGKVMFPPTNTPDDHPQGPSPNALPMADRVGFAIVGLGRLSVNNILPAFARSKRAKPVALVSGSPDKANVLAAQYGIKPQSVYSYDDFERLADNPEVKAAYIVLPNTLHREYVERAAKAGKHVLCEKPMATSSEECRAMIAACKEASVKLMIAYRCQYEPFNRAMMKLARGGEYGALKLIDAVNGQNQDDPTQWRLKAGGAPMLDVGIYCLNIARFITGEEPIEVYGRTYAPAGDMRFTQVEESDAFMLRFPSGVIANCMSSYGIHESRFLRLQMEKSWANLDNAFAYQGQVMKVAHKSGEIEIVEERDITPKDHFALELDHMAQCIAEDKVPYTPGEEGLQDHVIIEAFYQSAREGRPVSLKPSVQKDATRGTPPDEKG